MEAASAPAPEQTAAPQVDVSAIHSLLEQAEQEFHRLFEGRVADEVARFGPHLSTVRMVVDQAADRVSKGD